MSKELEALEDLSKQEIIVKKGIGIYMDGSVQTMPHKTTIGVEFKGHIENLKQALTKLQAIEEAKPSEVLELVDKMANYILLDEEYGFIDDEEKQAIIKDRDTIKQALTELKDIKEAEPSEAMECLRNLRYHALNAWVAESVQKDYNIVEQALLKAQEQEKVLEIIRQKNVNIGLVNVLGSVEQYNQTYVYDNMLNVKWCLTQEEFDTLKRWCEKCQK